MIVYNNQDRMIDLHKGKKMCFFINTDHLEKVAKHTQCLINMFLPTHNNRWDSIIVSDMIITILCILYCAIVWHLVLDTPRLFDIKVCNPMLI